MNGISRQQLASTPQLVYAAESPQAKRFKKKL